MPRWNQDASPDAAAQAVRRRFASRMETGSHDPALLSLPDHENPVSSPDRLTTPSRLRWRTPWRVAALVTVLVVGLIAVHLWTSATEVPTTEPLGPSTSVETSAEAAHGPDSTESPQPLASQQAAVAGNAGSLLVHVAGAVQKPGVVSLPAGSRVFQAIEAAGGAASNADVGGLNLAEVLSDGIKIQVPAVGESPSGGQSGAPGASGSPGNGGSSAGSAGGSAAKVNINTATVEELGTLPRVGPVTAQRIVDWRKEHGSFASVDEMDAVDGIGPKLMESLKDLVTVQGG